MIKRKILDLLGYDGKILYLLKEKGTMRFKELLAVCDPTDSGMREKKGIKLMTRGTLGKYLKVLKKQEYIIQIAGQEKDLRTFSKYEITKSGIEHLQQILAINEEDIPKATEEEVVRPDYFQLFYNPITQFFQKIGVEQEQYLPQLIRMVARIKPQYFFKLPQSDEFYYTLFYLYQNMLEFSLGKARFFFLGLDAFCDTYGVTKIQVQYHLEKLLNEDLGFYQINWEQPLFFQREDLIGGILLNLIQNELEADIVKKSLKLPDRADFHYMAENIIQQLIDLKLLWHGIRDAFQIFTEALLILKAIQRGYTRLDFMEDWPPFRRMLTTTQGIELSKKIFSALSEYKKLDLLQTFIGQISYIKSFIDTTIV
jgi:DNA-binding PadR family transcriptional regulator